ncbi:MAG: AraC family transcriptional regulator [Bacteroidaceae bacterium]|nr:AraC family transcriptional regulator [Bacteroidaceae bacterium]
MKSIFRFVLFFLVEASVMPILTGCNSNGGHQVVQQGDTAYTDQAAMMVHGTDPERALLILDSAVIVGNLDPFTADMLRAKVYGNTLSSEQRLDTAIQICEMLLTNDSTSIATPDGIRNRRLVLEQLCKSLRLKRDNESWLRYSIELSQLHRQAGDDVEALRTEAEICFVMTSLGQIDEGLSRLDDIIRKLDVDGSIDYMDAYIVATKRKINALQDLHRLHEIIPLALDIIQRLNHFTLHQQDYADDSFRLPNIPEDRQRYIDFYTAQALAFLSSAYVEDKPDSARFYMNLFDSTDYSRTFSGQRMTVLTRIALGDIEQGLSVLDEMERHLGTDTVNSEYATILLGRASAARMIGNIAQALDCQIRYTTLAKRLNDSLLLSRAHDYAAHYQVQEQKMKTMEAEADASRFLIIVIALSVMLFLLLGFSLYVFFQKRIVSEKNRALVRMINLVEPENSEQSVPEPSEFNRDDTSKALFETIDATIRNQRLYANASLQRQDVCDYFGINRHQLNSLLAAYSGKSSFTQYVNGIRMENALALLRENSDRSILSIATEVGFTPANFREQFKRMYGMTPVEFRQNL